MTARGPSGRREALLEATADYLLQNGVGDLSLRPLAAAVGTKARLLIYHFGSRDALVSAALSVVLRRAQEAFLTMHSRAALERAVMGFWRTAIDKANEPYLRLLLEVHGLAIRNPRLFGEYARRSLQSWKSLVTERLIKRKAPPRQREELATLIIAVVDGLLLDYVATGDRKRTTRALTLFTKGLRKLPGGAR